MTSTDLVAVLTRSRPAPVGSTTIDVCHIRCLGSRWFLCGLPIDEPIHHIDPQRVTVTPCVACGRPKCPLCAEAYSPAAKEGR